MGVALAGVPGGRLKLVANLPYNIATPVLSNLLACEHVPHSLVATIQKELGDRIVAQPWSKDYGALSVWVQCQADAEIVRVMPPSVFWPAPKVHSAIVRIVVDPERRAGVPDLHYFHQLTKALFIHRRKFLRANVMSAMKRHLDKAEVDDVLAEMQFTDDTPHGAARRADAAAAHGVAAGQGARVDAMRRKTLALLDSNSSTALLAGQRFLPCGV